jgi:hypothetical protein
LEQAHDGAEGEPQHGVGHLQQHQHGLRWDDDDNTFEDGVMMTTPWCHGAMVPWCHASVWCGGVMMVVQCDDGVMMV